MFDTADQTIVITGASSSLGERLFGAAANLHATMFLTEQPSAVAMSETMIRPARRKM